jgi:hypothetical protein
VVLGGAGPCSDRHKPPLLVLTEAQARRVAGFPAVADFDALGEAAREIRLPRYGGASAEPEPPMVTEGEYVIVRGGRCNGFGPPRSFHTDDRVGRPGQGA